MNGPEIIQKVKALDLPKDSYVVFGSGPLAVAGLRKSQDIDLLVSSDTYAQLAASGWIENDKGLAHNPVTNDVFEAFSDWHIGSYNPSLEELLETADYIDGIPFVSLLEVRKWKQTAGRPKDLKDVDLINKYLTGK